MASLQPGLRANSGEKCGFAVSPVTLLATEFPSAAVPYAMPAHRRILAEAVCMALTVLAPSMCPRHGQEEQTHPLGQANRD
mmetsp:Transcript_8044/g.18795  ORF Transcript_8044/g.18795 Transcript_8044/m.18795 type:complete len:81 (-) Transcript_8044:180-422(-)